MARGWVPPRHRAPPRVVLRASAAATQLTQLKVYELKAICRARGLKVSGKKAELIDRISDADATALSEVQAQAPAWCHSGRR